MFILQALLNNFVEIKFNYNLCGLHELWIATRLCLTAYSLRSGKPIVAVVFCCLTASHNPTIAIALGKKRPLDVFYVFEPQCLERETVRKADIAGLV